MGKENDRHRKKMVAPVVITVLFTSYLLVYAVLLLRSGTGSPLFALLAVPLLGLGIGMVFPPGAWRYPAESGWHSGRGSIFSWFHPSPHLLYRKSMDISSADPVWMLFTYRRFLV